MARKLFEFRATRARAGGLAVGIEYVVWDNEAATVLADISTSSGGSSIAGSTVTTADIAGLGPSACRFWGPTDDQDTLWVTCPSDPTLGVQRVEASTDARLDALEAGGGGSVAAHEADTTAIHGIADTAQVALRTQMATNVKVHGALGDGTTNDTAAFHSARDTAGVNGSVYVPPGTYMVNQLTLNVVGQHWLLSARTTLKLRNGQNTTAILLNGAKMTFEGGTLDGNKANQTDGSGINIQADDVTVRGVTVQDAFFYGIYAGAKDRVTIDRCIVTDSNNSCIFCQVQAGDAADMHDLTISGNVTDRLSLSAATIIEGNISAKGTATRKMLRLRIIGNACRLPTNPTNDTCGGLSTIYAPAAVMQGNTVRGSAISISMVNSDAAVVVGNAVTEMDLYGIEIADSKNAAVSGNSVDGGGLGSAGIICDNYSIPSKYTAITGNTVRNLASSGNGIYVGRCDHPTIVGNTVELTASGSGIYLTEAPNFSIQGNMLYGGGVAGQAVQLDGVGSGNTWRGSIVGNSIDQFTSNGILLVTYTNQDVDYVTIVGNVITMASGSRVGTSLNGSGVLGTNVRLAANPGMADYLDYKNNVQQLSGTGTPESAVTAGVGSMFYRTDGGANTTLYVKQTGTGNTGWFPVTP